MQGWACPVSSGPGLAVLPGHLLKDWGLPEGGAAELGQGGPSLAGASGGHPKLGRRWESWHPCSTSQTHPKATPPAPGVPGVARSRCF